MTLLMESAHTAIRPLLAPVALLSGSPGHYPGRHSATLWRPSRWIESRMKAP